MKSVRAGCLVPIGIVMLAGSLVANAAVGELDPIRLARQSWSKSMDRQPFCSGRARRRPSSK